MPVDRLGKKGGHAFITIEIPEGGESESKEEKRDSIAYKKEKGQHFKEGGGVKPIRRTRKLKKWMVTKERKKKDLLPCVTLRQK